jgi:hypothetical protein
MLVIPIADARADRVSQQNQHSAGKIPQLSHQWIQAIQAMRRKQRSSGKYE